MADDLKTQADAYLALTTATLGYDDVSAQIIRAYQQREAELITECERLRSRFTNLDKPKHTGEPMLDHVLVEHNPEFAAWVETLSDTYWARYDLSAMRIGWEGASALALTKQQRVGP